MSSTPMKRSDLFDWIVAHGCETEFLDQYKANVIYFVNPKNNCRAWLNLPINDTPVKDYTVCRICSSLQIEVPSQSDYMKGTVEKINKNHSNRS